MDWPVPENWRCPVCDSRNHLIWGLPHGECRCEGCHNIFTMGSVSEKLTEPKSLLLPNFLEAARKAVKDGKKLDDLLDADWTRYGVV